MNSEHSVKTSAQVVFDSTTLASAWRTTAEALDWPTSFPAKLGLLCLSDEHVTSCDHCQASVKLRALRPLRLNPAACYKLQTI